MAINEQTFYYALYLGKTRNTDSQGYYTGESSINYDTPVECKANISAARGEASTEPFGNDVDYDRTIVTCEDLPIDEQSILWIGISTDNPHNYIVKKVAKSLNVLSIAVKKVEK